MEVLLNVRRRHEFLPNRTPPVEHKERNVIRAVGHMSSCSQEKGIVKIYHKKESGLSFDCSKRKHLAWLCYKIKMIMNQTSAIKMARGVKGYIVCG